MSMIHLFLKRLATDPGLFVEHLRKCFTLTSAERFFSDYGNDLSGLRLFLFDAVGRDDDFIQRLKGTVLLCPCVTADHNRSHQ
jgi:hypothetical protein